MGAVDGLGNVRKRLDNVAKRYKSNVSYVVGYSAPYAVFVHENLDAEHVVGKAKYLEDPAKRLNYTGAFTAMVQKAISEGKTMDEALLLCALMLLRESQEEVPVDTGFLRNSAYIEKDTV